MKIVVKVEESEVFNGRFIELCNWESHDEIIEMEPAIRKSHNPRYIFCAIDSYEVKAIQKLEKHGFRFSEFRVISFLTLDKKTVSDFSFFPYKVEKVRNEKYLEEIIHNLIPKFSDDRFFNDPLIDKNIAKQRELENIKKSFSSPSQEFILGLFNIQTKKLIGFRSGCYRSQIAADYYLYGIFDGFDTEHFSQILEIGCINYLFKQGVQFIYTVSTGFNITELNRLIKHHGFKIKSTKVLLRKIYN